MNRCGEVVTRDDVLLATWRASPRAWPDRRPLNSNALEVYVHRLRKKLDQSSLNIRNIRGLGYMLEKAMRLLLWPCRHRQRSGVFHGWRNSS